MTVSTAKICNDLNCTEITFNLKNNCNYLSDTNDVQCNLCKNE